MGLQQAVLTDYDMIVAVTQGALNAALSSWLLQQPEAVALYWNIDNQGNFIPTTSDNAQISFTGTFAPNRHDLLQIITLNTKQPQVVQYTMTFQNGEFKGLGFDLKQTTSTPWLMHFNVNLALQPTTIDKLPTNVQTQIQNQVENLGPNMFAIQQLFVDLNTAALATFEGIDGLSDLASSMLETAMKLYMQQQQQQAAMIFGYTLSATPQNDTPPTFMPTALDFCVSPYVPISDTSPPLDTLNYLIMTGNAALPAYAPQGFSFNWVDQATDSGAVAIRHDLIMGQIVGQLGGLPALMSPIIKVDAHANGDSGAITVDSGSSGTFTLHTPPLTNNVIADYSYTTGPLHDHVGFFGGSTDVDAEYSSACSVQAGVDHTGNADPSKLYLSGTFSFSGTIASSSVGGGGETTLPETTYTWYVTLQLEADLTNTGQLDLVVVDSDFSSDPVVAKHENEKWLEFLGTLAMNVQTYATDLGGVRTNLQNQVLNTILPALKSQLAVANHFVFPGAQTFLFANPQFAPQNDLVANITYQSSD